MPDEELKREFIDLSRQAAGKRRDFKSFTNRLESADFFTAPAGSKHQGAEEGGLLQHTMNVHKRLMAREREAAYLDEAQRGETEAEGWQPARYRRRGYTGKERGKGKWPDAPTRL